MTTDWSIVAPMAVFAVAFAIVARLPHESWFAPGPFFAAAWVFYILVPIVLAPDFFVGVWALGWILVAMLAVSTGSLLGLQLSRTDPARRSESDDVRSLVRPLVALTLAGTVAGLASLWMTLADLGYGIQVLFSIDELIEMAAENSIKRYHEDYVPPPFARVLTTGVYYAPLAGGMLFAAAEHRSRRLVSLLPFLPATLLTIALTTKASLMLCVGAWVSSYFTARYVLNINAARRRAGFSMIWGAVLLALAAGILFFAQIARYGNRQEVGYIFEVLRATFLGYLTAFSTWLDLAIPHVGTSPAWGAFTFAGLYDMLGLATRQPGVFGPESVDVGVSSSNVYGAFRSLMEDFNPAGALVALSFAGVCAGFAFGRARKGCIACAAIVTVFYAFTLWSPVTNIFAYNTLLLAFGLWWFTALWLGEINGARAGRLRR